MNEWIVFIIFMPIIFILVRTSSFKESVFYLGCIVYLLKITTGKFISTSDGNQSFILFSYFYIVLLCLAIGEHIRERKYKLKNQKKIRSKLC